MSATAFRATIKNLERKRANLRRQQSNLIINRQKLLLRHALLTAWVDSLALLQAQCVFNQHQEPVQQQLQQLLDEEIALLGELALSEQLTCSPDGQQGLPDPGPNTLSQGVCMTTAGTIMQSCSVVAANSLHTLPGLFSSGRVKGLGQMLRKYLLFLCTQGIPWFTSGSA